VRWDGGSGGYVLWIGRFDPEHKGLDLLLEGMKLLPAGARPVLRLHGPDWAGGKERVIELVRNLELDDSVIIGDPVYGEEKWRLISQASAFVYPSRWEGFGNSTAEAVTAGVPTLVTPYPLGKWLAARDAVVLAQATPEGLAGGLTEVLAHSAARAANPDGETSFDELTWAAVARTWLAQVREIV
jgi:glycosyltransferase involved in cell wall biosynthesis